MSEYCPNCEAAQKEIAELKEQLGRATLIIGEAVYDRKAAESKLKVTIEALRAYSKHGDGDCVCSTAHEVLSQIESPSKEGKA